MTKQGWVSSDNTSCALSSDSIKAQERISAMDVESNNYSNNTVSTINNSSMLKTMGAEEGTNTRSLRPREHMNKLSEYVS